MRHCIRFYYFLLSAALSFGTAWAEVQIVPTPQYLEVLTNSLIVNRGGTVAIVIGPAGVASSPKMKLAAEWLRDGLNRMSASVQVRITDQETSGSAIRLWNWTAR